MVEFRGAGVGSLGLDRGEEALDKGERLGECENQRGDLHSVRLLGARGFAGDVVVAGGPADEEDAEARDGVGDP